MFQAVFSLGDTHCWSDRGIHWIRTVLSLDPFEHNSRPFLSAPGKTEFLPAFCKTFKTDIFFQLSYACHVLFGFVAVWKSGWFFLRKQQGTCRFNKHLFNRHCSVGLVNPRWVIDSTNQTYTMWSRAKYTPGGSGTSLQVFPVTVPFGLRAFLLSKMTQTDPVCRLDPTWFIIVEFSPIFKLSSYVIVLNFQLPKQDDSQLSHS